MAEKRPRSSRDDWIENSDKSKSMECTSPVVVAACPLLSGFNRLTAFFSPAVMFPMCGEEPAETIVPVIEFLRWQRAQRAWKTCCAQEAPEAQLIDFIA